MELSGTNIVAQSSICCNTMFKKKKKKERKERKIINPLFEVETCAKLSFNINVKTSRLISTRGIANSLFHTRGRENKGEQT